MLACLLGACVLWGAGCSRNSHLLSRADWSFLDGFRKPSQTDPAPAKSSTAHRLAGLTRRGQARADSVTGDPFLGETFDNDPPPHVVESRAPTPAMQPAASPAQTPTGWAPDESLQVRVTANRSSRNSLRAASLLRPGTSTQGDRVEILPAPSEDSRAGLKLPVIRPGRPAGETATAGDELPAGSAPQDEPASQVATLVGGIESESADPLELAAAPQAESSELIADTLPTLTEDEPANPATRDATDPRFAPSESEPATVQGPRLAPPGESPATEARAASDASVPDADDVDLLDPLPLAEPALPRLTQASRIGLGIGLFGLLGIGLWRFLEWRRFRTVGRFRPPDGT